MWRIKVEAEDSDSALVGTAVAKTLHDDEFLGAFRALRRTKRGLELMGCGKISFRRCFARFLP